MRLRRRFEKRCVWRVWGEKRHAMLHGVAPWNLYYLECMLPRLPKVKRKVVDQTVTDIYLHIWKDERL